MPADVAVDSGRITEVGTVQGGATQVIEADGLLVTPGWVDVHTHYDGQVTWDSELAPSSWHGVTTLVMGNCGVGFAPAQPDRHDWLIGLMEGVEDIPGTALAEGIEWEWETFPEYLDALEQRRWTVDVGTQVPHAAVRAYVMGERGARNEAATAEDIEAMRAIVLEAIRAGALGFSTSRTLGHRAIDGELVPGTFAAEDELFGIGSALGEAGAGVFELAPLGSAGEMLEDAWQEVDWMRRLSAAIDRPVSYVLLQADDDPELWRKQLAASLEACAEGRPPLPADRGAPDRDPLGAPHDAVPVLRVPGLRGAAGPLRVAGRAGGGAGRPRGAALDRVVDAVRRRPRPMRWPRPTSAPSSSATRPTTSPGPSAHWPAWPRRAGGRPLEVAYDEMARDGGQGLLYIPILNYATGDLDHVREMLLHPQGLLGLADGGAHTGTICDASMPTFMLTHWTRDRSRGESLPLEYVVKKQTHDTARLYGLADRGTVEPGALADFNLIDYDALTLGAPFVTNDLPAGGRRLLQKASGYVATIKAGTVTFAARRADRRTAGPPGARRPLSPADRALRRSRRSRHSPTGPAPPEAAARQTATRMEAPLTQYALRDGVHVGYQVWGGEAGGRRASTCSSSTAAS